MRFARTGLLALAVLPGCNAAHRLEVREGRDKAGLAEASGEYWKGVRWNDVAVASKFLASADDQLALARVLASPVLRISDVKVLQVAVDPELVDPKTRPEPTVTRREGVILVRVEWYEVAGTRVVVESVEQRWRMDGTGWTVDTTRSPLDADRPW